MSGVNPSPPKGAGRDSLSLLGLLEDSWPNRLMSCKPR
jgi:hypothetical protein